MEQTQSTNSTEQRRKLLKGALAASGVVSLGYSGAALASLGCVEKVRTDGGYPAGGYQFRTTAPTSNGTAWAWTKVEIAKYQAATGPKFDAFTINGLVYKVPPITTPPTAPTSVIATLKSSYSPPKYGWVLAYFDDTGAPTANYPTVATATQGQTPAAESCLTSLNAGIVGNFTFGG